MLKKFDEREIKGRGKESERRRNHVQGRKVECRLRGRKGMTRKGKWSTESERKRKDLKGRKVELRKVSGRRGIVGGNVEDRK